MKLVIAEKPSVAISIAKALGVKNKKVGHIEGNDYIISWCVGHLLQLVNPEFYNNKYKKWKLEDLPIMPGINNYKYEISEKTKKQYNLLNKLLNDKRVDEVINACDAGREGELIFRLVYKESGCTKPIKRLWISSLENSSIRDGFNNLRDGNEFDNLYSSALARSKADWLVGINLSRYYTIKYGDNEVFSVGRVQTPTLYMIANREESIKNFVKEKYYTIAIITDSFTLVSNRIDKLEEAKNIEKRIKEQGLKISEVIKKKKTTKPPLLYDLTTLQREANKIYGFSASDTLDITQILYENKLITYPRTDSKYLSEDIKELTKKLVKTPIFDEDNFNKLFNNSKVTDHHAIIFTEFSLQEENTKNLKENELKILNLIKHQTIASSQQDLIENTTKIIAKLDNINFEVNGKIILQKGFSELISKKDVKDVILPFVKQGDNINIKDAKIEEKWTTPPSSYNENTLLKSMETAGNKDIQKGVEVERKGIGTPATRASIIENLISKKLITREDKKLLPTQKGIRLLEVASGFLKSPKTTAKLEMKLTDIVKGKVTEKEFLNDIITNINEIINEV